MAVKSKEKISGEYSKKGDYHKKLDKNWPYFPVYVEKMNKIEEIMRKHKYSKILDAGCGEGVLVEKYKKKGYNIKGLDANYSSELVIKGDIKDIPFKDNEFDLVLCLDVLEHMNFSEHESAIKEIKRVVKKGGYIVFGLPNLAHFASRLSFLFTGRLIRTSEIERHKGDRPIKEFLDLMKKNNLKIIKRIGLFPTFPIISFITLKTPSKSLFLHRIYNKIFQFPNFCFENLIILK